MAYDAKKIYYRFDDHLSRLVLDYEASRQISPESENLYYGLPTDPYDEDLFVEHNVKRGLRNADGSGVVAGLTRISDVHGYNKVDGKVVPDHGMTKPICANIDLYTGFIYKMLGVPETLFTPMFAVARMAGWSAHRMEELFCAHRIIRPAYRPVIEPLEYKPLADR